MNSPNIVLIMTDQQRADFSGVEGYPLDVMPFIDSLGAGGGRFRRAYTPMPVCAPARCSLFTGRFPQATGVRENGGSSVIRRPKDLIEILRELGYSINLCGKNHSYLDWKDFDFVAPTNHTGAEGGQAECEEDRRMDDWLRGLHFQALIQKSWLFLIHGHCLGRLV